MRFFTILLLVCPLLIQAQKKAHPGVVNGTNAACGGPGRVPNSGQAVCGNITFTQQFVPSCTGLQDLYPSGCADEVSSDNSYWYKFHCYQAGTFGFVLNPGNAADDYDWEIMDVTGHDPNDVYTTNLMVSLNLSGIAGKTGCTTAGTLDVHCAGGVSGSQYNQLLNLVAGHDYLMMVNNWSNSGTGYTLDFSGTAVLTDNALPAVTGVSVVGCNPSAIKVTFSEDILCSTITATGSEFTINTGTHVITGIASDCSIGANSVPYLTINLQSPLTPGAYTLDVNAGTDGNTFQNVCKQDMLPAAGIPFTVSASAPLTITNVGFTGCAPSVLNVDFSKPYLCSSVTAAGSEFFIMPGNPAITGVTNSCTADRSGSLSIQLQNPLPYGNYTLNIKSGSDGNTIRDTCGIDIAAGYSIPFVIPQTTTPPAIQSIEFDECKPNKITVYFDKVIACGTVDAVGSDFSVSPGGPVVTAAAPDCGANTYTNKVVLTLQNNLPGGNFNVNINTGTDGNTIADTCYSFIAAGYSKSFTATQAPAPIFDSVQFDRCTPSTIKVFYNHAIFCSSISADGSDFTITGPAPVSITGATTDVTCSDGYTNWILLQLSAPATVYGTYTLHNTTGSDGNGIIDTCSAVQQNSNSLAFTILGVPPAVFTSQVIWACEQDTIIFSHAGGYGITAWHWAFSDGTTDDGQTVRHTFPITTLTVNAKLTVSNGYCENSTDQDITLGNTFTPAFTQNPADTTCINLPVSFTDASIGTGLQYLWQFGDAATFAGQNPPPHSYTAAGNYTIRLVLTDVHGCKDTASHQLLVTPFATVDFTGLRPQYCTGNTVALKGVYSRYIDAVKWASGNGDTILNKINVQFTYPNQGAYTINLTGYDRFCGQVSNSKTIPVYTIPVVDLGRDTVLCPDVNMQIGAAYNPAYTYTWNTGATTPTITTDIFTRKYILTADNHGCSATDEVTIKLLPSCLIKVPNAFTPNADGLNDKLMAVNADLARSFSLKVYNRMGQLMFATTDPLQGWDGTYKGNKVDNGTYVWELTYINPWTNKPVSEKGTAILLR